MVILEQCRIDSEGKHLIIEAAIENLSYYKDVNIAAVIIDTQDTFIDSGPSNRAIYHVSYEEEDYVVDSIEDCSSIKTEESCKCSNIVTAQKHGHKKVRLCLTEKDLGVSLNDNIFFVYIVTNGIPSPCTPCGMDNLYTMGVAVNLRPIYNMAMGYIKELDSNCLIPRGFIDMILRIKAFKLSLRTGNYPMAFKQWNTLFKNKVRVSPNRGCGCNGIN